MGTAIASFAFGFLCGGHLFFWFETYTMRFQKDLIKNLRETIDKQHAELEEIYQVLKITNQPRG